jgi:transcriptional regulator with XRE-family HTH domain
LICLNLDFFEVMESIGNQLKELSQKSGLKQKEIAEHLEISVQHLHNLFTKDSIETKYAIRAAELFKVPVSTFFSEYNLLNQKEIETLLDVRNDYVTLIARSTEYKKTIYLVEMILNEIKNNEEITLNEVRSKINDVLEFTKLSTYTLNQFPDKNKAKGRNVTDLIKDIDSIIEKTQIQFNYPKSDQGGKDND